MQDGMIMAEFEYAKQQLKLTPDVSLEMLRKMMQKGVEYNTETVISPDNALNFRNSLKWLEKFDSIEQVKKELGL